MIMLGSGLQSTLLGVRATIEDFSFLATGLIMSAYYVGYLTGSLYVPTLVKNVGHIRVFSALASLASATVLLNGIFVYPLSWLVVRLITGLAYAGMLIVVESWLNDLSNNKNRGKILAAYMIVTYGAMFFGQFLLNVASPAGLTLFVLTSILVSIALLPISLSTRPAPKIEAPKRVNIKTIFAASPTGTTGVLVAGMIGATLLTMGPVFASESGLETSEIALFMATIILGGICGQMPFGLLSDVIGRRFVIIMISLCTIINFAICYEFSSHLPILYLGLFFGGAFALSLYPISMAYTNDFLRKDQFVGASATLILLTGTGSFIAPFACSILMTTFGYNVYFLFISGICVPYLAFILYRMTLNPTMPVEDQGDYISMPARSTVMTAQLANDDPTKP